MLIEAGLQPIEIRATQNSISAYDKSLRLQPNNPRRKIAVSQGNRRTKKNEWRPFAASNWRDTFGNTDGSASVGISKGGSGVVIANNDYSNPRIHETITTRGAEITSSYEEECHAMLTACEWIKANGTKEQTILIMTDSKSICDALEAKKPSLNSILYAVSTCTARIICQWVSAHCGIPGNEAADRAAKKAISAPGATRPISYTSACAAIKRHVKDGPLRRTEHRETYLTLCKKRELEIMSRRDQVDLARLRSGYHPKLKNVRTHFKSGHQCDVSTM